jgi:CRISPR-associated autoregulator DevR family
MEKPGFLTVAVKLIVNVHDMNNEGSIGNTTDIRMIRMVGEDGKEVGEAPAVSGRMMKHWHLAYMLKEELNQSTPKLCNQCKIWEPERKPQDEGNGINACIICDSHGFLCTDKPGFKAKVELSENNLVLKKEVKEEEPEELFSVIPCEHSLNDLKNDCPTCALRKLAGKNVRISGEISLDEEGSKTIEVTFVQEPGKGTNKIKVGKDPKGLSLRRSSCVNFSWLLPVLDTNSTSKQVIHSRVASAGGNEDEKSSQMIFYKNYASSSYAFICSIDLDRIGKPLIGSGLDNTIEIKRRREIAIKALLPMVMGAFGASQSHALPHAKCVGILAALSDYTTPLPNLISPIYKNGFDESITILKEFKKDKVKYWGYGEANVEKELTKDNIQALFKSVLGEMI